MTGLMTSIETAAHLRMSRRSLVEKAKTGEIRASKVGRQWLFEPQAIDDFMAARSNVRPAVTQRRRRRRAT